MVDFAPQAAAQADTAARPATRRYYVLALLTAVYALNFLDRTIFNVLIEPIKKEFALSDTTMGLLAGFGFVLFYSLLGIPIVLNMAPTGGDKWEGQVYNAEDGGTYTGSFTMTGANTAELKGCVMGGLICKGQTWTRAN